jgi:hypothetical protein
MSRQVLNVVDKFGVGQESLVLVDSEYGVPESALDCRIFGVVKQSSYVMPTGNKRQTTNTVKSALRNTFLTEVIATLSTVIKCIVVQLVTPMDRFRLYSPYTMGPSQGNGIGRICRVGHLPILLRFDKNK